MEKVVIVNGTVEILDLIDTLVAAGHYGVVFVESSAHAYSQVRREHPSLVVVCLNLDDPSGFHVLSMLKMDEDTRNIPVLTYMSDCGVQPTHEWSVETADSDLLQRMPAASMN